MSLSPSRYFFLMCLKLCVLPAIASAEPAAAAPSTAGATEPDDSDPARTAARQLGYAGVEAYEAGDYAVAHAKLEQAYQKLRVPSLGLWSARVMVKLGQLVHAVDRYGEVARLDTSTGAAPVQKQAQVDASRELEALLRRVPRVFVSIAGAQPENVTVLIDDKVLSADALRDGALVDPGTHHVQARQAAALVDASVKLDEAQRKTVLLDFARAPSPAPGAPRPAPRAPAEAPPRSGSFQRTAGWIGIVGGAVGVGVGAVTGGLALSKLGSIHDSNHCRDVSCSPEERDLVDSYNTLRTTSTIAFIAGGVLAAGGATLLFTLPSDRATGVSFGVGPGIVSATRHF